MGIKIIARNKRAGFDFELLEKTEVGLVLQGTEVKSLRLGKVSLHEAFVTIDSRGEAWIQGMSIPPYPFGTYANHEETRKRKLLLHKKELRDIDHTMRIKGLTLIPTVIYFKESRVKMEISLAKGKKLHDKRQTLKEKDIKRQLQKSDYS